MFGISTYIYHKNQLNLGKCTISMDPKGLGTAPFMNQPTPSFRSLTSSPNMVVFPVPELPTLHRFQVTIVVDYTLED